MHLGPLKRVERLRRAGESQAASAGPTVFVPAGAERGVEATTRLALLAVRVAD